MDEIRIGRGPDFCMMRGNALLSYKAKVCLQDLSKTPKLTLISDRSLAMISKKLTQFISGYKIDEDVKLESMVEKNELTAKLINEKKQKITIKLVLPKELSRKQLSDINAYFINQMKARL